MKKGIFISFEGPDGSGKSTQVGLLAEHCRRLGYTVRLTREPGGTPISEKIRDILLDTGNSEMAGWTEAFLYAASRAQHVREVIIPAVEAGEVVICDRFMDSSIAYQGYARGLGEGVRTINEIAVQGMMPDLTFFMDLDPAVGKARVYALGHPDRLEQEALDFHRRVYEGYRQLSGIYKDRYLTIDAEKSVEEIANEIAGSFDRYVAGKAD